MHTLGRCNWNITVHSQTIHRTQKLCYFIFYFLHLFSDLFCMHIQPRFRIRAELICNSAVILKRGEIFKLVFSTVHRPMLHIFCRLLSGNKSFRLIKIKIASLNRSANKCRKKLLRIFI